MDRGTDSGRLTGTDAGAPLCGAAEATAAGPGMSVSVIVPTRNEADNVRPLLRLLGAAAPGLVTEVIFVDDSTDATPDVVRAEVGRHPFEVRLIARPPERRNGLGMAVVEGLRAATATWVCVMDGDLQHPPEVLPQLVDRAHASGATLVAASRLTDGGGTEGLSPFRRLVSVVLARAARVVFPQRLRRLSDPLTGFFLLRRDAVDPDRLRPEGFKILLEIVVRTPTLEVAEVPFEFARRVAGASKASSGEMLKLVRQVLRLSLSARSRLLRFGLVGVTGIAVNTALLALFTPLLGHHLLLAAVLATQGSTAWNFALSELWVFPDRTTGGAWARLLQYALVNDLLLVPRGPLLLLLAGGLRLPLLLANVASILLIFVLRYVVSDRLIWRGRAALPLTTGLSSEASLPLKRG